MFILPMTLTAAMAAMFIWLMAAKRAIAVKRLERPAMFIWRPAAALAQEDLMVRCRSVVLNGVMLIYMCTDQRICPERYWIPLIPPALTAISCNQPVRQLNGWPCPVQRSGPPPVPIFITIPAMSALA